ncbi:MAG: biotin synthase, partial [Flavobacteriales bacterium]
MQEIRNNWAEGEIREIFNMPLLQLLYRAATVHRQHHHPGKVQVSALLSVKTGGCPEDCGYCPQSVHNGAKVKVHGILPLEEVRAAAEKAREAGASRI